MSWEGRASGNDRLSRRESGCFEKVNYNFSFGAVKWPALLMWCQRHNNRARGERQRTAAKETPRRESTKQNQNEFAPAANEKSQNIARPLKCIKRLQPSKDCKIQLGYHWKATWNNHSRRWHFPVSKRGKKKALNKKENGGEKNKRNFKWNESGKRTQRETKRVWRLHDLPPPPLLSVNYNRNAKTQPPSDLYKMEMCIIFAIIHPTSKCIDFHTVLSNWWLNLGPPRFNSTRWAAIIKTNVNYNT